MEGEIVCLIVRLSLHVQVMAVPACKRLGCLSHANGWVVIAHVKGWVDLVNAKSWVFLRTTLSLSW